MNSYNRKSKKSNILLWLIGEALFIFVIATASIVLYDMYINIDIEKEEIELPKKITKEVSAEKSQESISDVLEDASKSVARYI